MKISFPVVLCFLLLSSSLTEPAFSDTSYDCESAYCSSKCSNRCAVAGAQDRCLKYCGICCDECKCVPSGTYGNKHECPCYRDMSALDDCESAYCSSKCSNRSAYCSSKCSNRCAVAGAQDRCLKYCGISCDECKCVPSGTYGNKHECPCYTRDKKNDKKNSKGKPKCPRDKKNDKKNSKGKPKCRKPKCPRDKKNSKGKPKCP